MGDINKSLDAFLAERGVTVDNNEQPVKVEIPKECWLDVTQDIEETRFLLSYNGVGFSPLGDIQVLKGVEGNGKSFLFTLFMAAVLRGEYCGLECRIPNARVLYVDTEQHRNNVLMVARRIHHILGWRGKEPNERFRVLTLREVDDYQQRQKYLMESIEEFKPTAVFIDGVADVVSSINDQAECKEFVSKLMALSSKKHISIWSVLHVNYGSEKMRGHLGTEMALKASDVFKCSKDKSLKPVLFTVEQIKARNMDLDNFKFINKNDETPLGIPFITTATDINADTEANKRGRDELMKEIFQNMQLLSKKAVVDAIIMKRFIAGDDRSKYQAKLWFENAVDWGIIKLDNHARQYYYIGLDADPFEVNASEQDIFDD